MKPYLTLAIDTSCDETSVAITANNRVIANAITSQIEYHQESGGVIPAVAKRMHQQFIDQVVSLALRRASHAMARRCDPESFLDAIAVTVGPGLAPALEVGIAKAKELAIKYNKPLIAVNHMEAHLLSSFAVNSKGNGPFATVPPQFPILALLISGGHTQLVLATNFGQYCLLGETLDDAAGEAFDKVAKMLNLGYPGGPIISELAKAGNPIYILPVPMVGSKNLNFSFSGLKTACLYQLDRLKKQGKKFDREFYCDFSASFVKTVAKSLTIKLEKAIILSAPRQIVLGGGVISNSTIRKEIRKSAAKFNLPVFIPYSNRLFTDNAAMVGVAAWYQAQRKDFVKTISSLDRLPSLNF